MSLPLALTIFQLTDMFKICDLTGVGFSQIQFHIILGCINVLLTKKLKFYRFPMIPLDTFKTDSQK